MFQHFVFAQTLSPWGTWLEKNLLIFRKSHAYLYTKLHPVVINLEIQPELLLKDLVLAVNTTKNVISNFWSPHLKGTNGEFWDKNLRKHLHHLFQITISWFLNTWGSSIHSVGFSAYRILFLLCDILLFTYSLECIFSTMADVKDMVKNMIDSAFKLFIVI